MKCPLLTASLFATALTAGTLSSPAVLGAEPLGRLFFTPGQRSALDAGKRIGEPQMTRAPAPRGPRELKLDGVVTRSDGESTVWVNGRSLSADPLSGFSASASAADPAAARLELRGARTPIRVRVGQRVDPSTGKVTEAYQDPAVLADDAAGMTDRLVAPQDRTQQFGTEPRAADVSAPAN